MCPLNNFDPTPAVTYWINKKQRHPKLNAKAHKQEWFNDVFDEATNIEKKQKFQPIVEF